MRLKDAPQPFQYQGSKRAIASAILSKLDLRSYSLLMEPFAGSAAVSIRAVMESKVNSIWLNDVNEPLIDLWNAILHDTESLIEQYTEIWELQKNNPKEYYNKVRARFNGHPEPADLLYLLSRAIKGAVRYNSVGEFNQSPDNRRLGTRPTELAKRLRIISTAMNSCTYTSSIDYRDLIDKYEIGQVWYMDPPYEGVSKQRDSRYLSTIGRNEFEEFLDHLNDRGVPYLLSYDGRTGDKTYGRPLADKLGLERVEILAGRSTTSTLQGRDEKTIESLYLSPALEVAVPAKENESADQMALDFASENYAKAS
ncbi:MAG: DNA adenine methylase [bacterium]|nr:DNA adenine methylase [bacterium]